MAELIKYSFNFKIRFSEIDAMRVVWHGAYVKYFEDAREMFGEKFNLSYKMMEEHGYYAPIVDFPYNTKSHYAMIQRQKSPLFTILQKLRKLCSTTKSKIEIMAI